MFRCYRRRFSLLPCSQNNVVWQWARSMLALGFGGILAPLISGALIRSRGISRAFEFLCFCMAVRLVMVLALFWISLGKSGSRAARNHRCPLLRGRPGQ